MNHYKLSRFWFYYFFIRLFYLFFTVLIYARLTTLGDTDRYLSASIKFSSHIFYSSTRLMEFIGGVLGIASGGNMILSNFPFMLISFFTIRWTIETLALRKHINNMFLMVMISLPNFCIWTSVCSKEVFGLVFSAIFAVLIINFLNGKFKIRIRDIAALYFCLIFKPQYFPFILQGLMFIYATRKMLNHKPAGQLILAVIFLSVNLLFLYLIKDIVNKYAGQMYLHFIFDQAKSTRDNIFLKDNDFFIKAPWGMFIAFFGPTFTEMLEKPTHLFAGFESLCVILFFFYLAKSLFLKLLLKGRIMPLICFSYFFVFAGICFIHYPFGVFNPGSAIRYRTNFIFLFIVLLLYLYTRYHNYHLIKNKQYS